MTVCENISALLLGDDPEMLGEYVRQEYGVEMSRSAVQSLANAAKQFMKQTAAPAKNWHGWNVWLKNRLTTSHGSSSQDTNHVTAIMHCFFVMVEETEEMMARLRGDKEKTSDAPARSKVSKYQSQLKPVNAVAARVGPPELIGVG